MMSLLLTNTYSLKMFLNQICEDDNCVVVEFKCFDQVLEAMKHSLAEDSGSAFIFNCSDGKDRTTTAMVIATLTLWHFNVGHTKEFILFMIGATMAHCLLVWSESRQV